MLLTDGVKANVLGQHVLKLKALSRSQNQVKKRFAIRVFLA